jgi:hypothetical protein
MNGKPLLKQKDLPKKERSLSLGQWRKKCDRLMQERGRLKCPKSLLSGLPTNVMHHFVPKSVSANLRYNWDNLIPLTNAEHCRLHQSPDPDIEMQIIDKKGIEWYHNLRLEGQKIIRVNVVYYKEVFNNLSQA